MPDDTQKAFKDCITVFLSQLTKSSNDC